MRPLSEYVGFLDRIKICFSEFVIIYSSNHSFKHPIVLLQETYDVLNRTSYPVILSMTTKENESGISKTKTQKLNHKDRMIAVVDGYGDPLKQKYRYVYMDALMITKAFNRYF